ncbi:MAG: transcriptional repressor LexA [Thermodesulfobacteriota bacterium]
MSVTQRQKDVLEFILSFQAREGYWPTVREICRGLGLASPGSLMKHLRALEEEGRLERRPGRNRTWRPAGGPAGPVIPVLGRIAAGAPLLAEEHRESDLPVDPALFGCRTAFALEVHGDSMIGAHIQDGDLAIIRPQEEVEDGGIAAVLVEGVEPEATLKILHRRKDRLELHPANPDYAPLVFRGPEQAGVRVLGRLVGVIRSRVHPDKLFPCVGRGFFSKGPKPAGRPGAAG